MSDFNLLYVFLIFLVNSCIFPNFTVSPISFVRIFFLVSLMVRQDNSLPFLQILYIIKHRRNFSEVEIYVDCR